MLDIKKVQSTNNVNVVGILNTMDIEKRVTKDGRDYITGNLTIKVDQEYHGQLYENEIPIRMFSMKTKRDGNINPIYASIESLPENFTSLAAAEDPTQATKVSIRGSRIGENNYLDKNGINRHTFQINTNFVNKASQNDTEMATWELSGVVGNIQDEYDKNGDETGRAIIKLVVVGYLGRVEVVDLIADDSYAPGVVNHFRSNIEKGDTILVQGLINMTHKTTTYYEEMGFGEPLKRTKTETKRELIITGSSTALDEELSYDNDSIKIALDDRATRISAMAEKKPEPPKKKTNNISDFGF